MKKIFLFLLSSTIIFGACTKKEVAPIQEQPSDEVYVISVPVKDDIGNTKTTLHFNSNSKEALDALDLNQIHFKAIEEGVNRPHDNSLESSCDNKASHVISNDHVRQEAEPINGPAVWVTMDDDISNVSIEVSYDAMLNNKRVSSLYPPNMYVRLVSGSKWRRVQVENLSENPLNVSFYYAPGCSGNVCTTIAGLGPYTKYSGYTYTLYKGGWAYYYNCSKDVAAKVSVDQTKSWSYKWTWWTVCKP